ncbi:MAG: glucose-6-phosphate isomerase [Gammaproteobacteria bacterium]|nr:glucose-6-phosphate isomerase [Gammaproteobacteria bacterium]
MDACDQKTVSKFNEWDDLRAIIIQDSFKKKISFGPLKLEIQHHQLNSTIFEKIADLALAQGFFTARQNWRQGQDEMLPPFMHLRLSEYGMICDKYQHDVSLMREQMQAIVEKIRSNQWLGYSGKPITDIVNIGIGGSDLGPKFYFDALNKLETKPQFKCHFISDADYYSAKECLEPLSPETTLFIVLSKSFTTEETMMNANLAIEWIGHADAMAKHFIAVTANPEQAIKSGYQHMIEFGRWVTGRFSVTSAINLINAIFFGFDSYLEFIKGAEEMDKHFLTAPWQDNLPMMLAFVGIWNINFLNIPTQLMLVYHSKLRFFVDYIQQLDMESNGKSYNKEGQKIDYATGPIIWGGLGNQSQHSYYQLLAQGSHQIAIDFLSIADDKNNYLNALCQKRKKSLYHGVQAKDEYYSIKQHASVNHIELTELTPRSLGALIAMYEHKVFIQASLWSINPFDQPGVDLVKLL